MNDRAVTQSPSSSVGDYLKAIWEVAGAGGVATTKDIAGRLSPVEDSLEGAPERLRKIVRTLADEPCRSLSGGMLPELAVNGRYRVQHGPPETFNFHGVSREGLEWGRYNRGDCGGDGHFTDSGYTNMVSRSSYSGLRRC